jgi:hypothetical protein
MTEAQTKDIDKTSYDLVVRALDSECIRADRLERERNAERGRAIKLERDLNATRRRLRKALVETGELGVGALLSELDEEKGK